MDHEDTLGITRLLPVRRKTMATLSLRMRDDLKQKVQQLAKEQGVSLNGSPSNMVISEPGA
jgi:predicted HicB family RNase H-like nuclease